MKKKIQRTKAKKAAGRNERKEKKTVSIEFCQKCNSIMIPVKKGKNIYLKSSALNAIIPEVTGGCSKQGR